MKELYLIFSRCFPQIPLNEENFCALLGEVALFTAEEDGRTVGFAALGERELEE